MNNGRTLFKVGEQVIYPAQGIARIESIETRTIGEEQMVFYVLKLLQKNMAVLVPTCNVSKIGLRRVTDSDAIEEVFQVLGGEPENHYHQWHHRYNDNFEKLKTGSLIQTAEVVRDLAALKRHKNLAIKESRMMANARELIVDEVAHALGIQQDEVALQIDEILCLNLGQVQRVPESVVGTG